MEEGAAGITRPLRISGSRGWLLVRGLPGSSRPGKPPYPPSGMSSFTLVSPLVVPPSVSLPCYSFLCLLLFYSSLLSSPSVPSIASPFHGPFLLPHLSFLPLLPLVPSLSHFPSHFLFLPPCPLPIPLPPLLSFLPSPLCLCPLPSVFIPYLHCFLSTSFPLGVSSKPI